MPIVRPTLVSIVIILIVSSSSFQAVAPRDEYLISQFSEHQEEDLFRIERLEARHQKAHHHHTSVEPGRDHVAGAPFAPSRSLSIRRRSVDVSSVSADRQANFLRGEPGRNGLDGVPGLDGAPGLDGVPGIDGRNGRDGANGRDGNDGKNGMPGEPGPMGPPGSPGEPGKRGKPGPPGKTGALGQPGVCAYKAKFDCGQVVNGAGQSANGSIAGAGALLVAPTMIGQVRGSNEDNNESSTDEGRQVTVNEGDNIQLACEAFGLPKPDYIWHRTINNIKSTILMDVVTDLQVTSYPGGQLPLFSVDRLQSGNYECIASNGVPPAAIKRINLDVNYAPTVRLYPGPSVHRVRLGSSLLIECLVDANPSSFTYWMFGTELIMSIAPPPPPSQVTPTSEEPLLNVAPPSKLKKYTITESTGQLTTGAYYTIVTLNVANINLDDLGLYKCVSKNLIGQTVGYLWVESIDGTTGGQTPVNTSDRKFRETILGRVSNYERFDHTLGWPSNLMERYSANYSIFDNGQRRQLNLDAKKSLLALNGLGRKVSLESLIQNQTETEPIKRLDGINGTEFSKMKKNVNQGKSDGPPNTMINHQDEVHNGGDKVDRTELIEGSVEGDIAEDGAVLVDEIKLCRVLSNLTKQLPSEERSNLQRSSFLLLDQVGKPVYVGSITGGLLNWWSMDSKFRIERSEINNDTSFSSHYYATSPNKTYTLFEYRSLTDLLQDQQMAAEKLDLELGLSTKYSLQYPIVGNSHIIYGRQFIYVTFAKSINSDSSELPRSIRDLMVIILDLGSGKNTFLKLENNIWRDLENQPGDLGPEYKLNRVELASDENGVWLIVPTLERSSNKLLDDFEAQSQNVGKRKSNLAQDKQLVRHLHVLKLDWPNELVAGQTSIQIEYHVSMKLDWRMIGQLFLIDGVLYGIKDRSLYSSKLQFAYDLYKCKLLSTEYLNEPHRTFTNHFGNTQMINYNPNEPKRLYTIDGGNLLWCPVKLIQN